MRYSWLILIVICLSCQQSYDMPVVMALDTNWQFKKTTDTTWYSATVPGNVFSDLLNHKLIEDPFVGTNEKNVQWVSETDWEYKTQFSVQDDDLQKTDIALYFEGLDTYAKVYLNDHLILKTNNAFRMWNAEVKSLLRPENELRIVFEPTSKYEAIEKAKLSYELPEGDRVFTRKAQFQYGWDWGPKLNVSGIWKPVRLEAWNGSRIQHVNIRQDVINDSIADLTAVLELSDASDEDMDYEIYVNDSLFREGELKKHLPNYRIPLHLKHPKRWWPHNIGEPYQYDFKFIIKQAGVVKDSITLKKGLRTVELITESDSIGSSFYFTVNDVPVYMKGANYIPQHSFQDKVTKEDYEALLSDVVEANMNMLRVWGGGIYENDIFYDLCDEKGVMVWQDFMFACAMYPGDRAFLQSVQSEATYNVKRLSDHASIALWCGNNESSEGWYRWGWQAGRSEREKEEIWHNYLKVFDTLLYDTVSALSDTPYWGSSPKYGRGNPNYKYQGDAHDWWVWHDGYPFEHFESNVPRFMSEFGFQSMPSYETVRYMNLYDTISVTSEAFKNHQKHSRGFQIIQDYMIRDFIVSDNAEDKIYMSQLLQAHGITKGIEAHRRAKPYNMGTLYWQLNDCWPAISWSSIDYFRNWKALHYKAKQSFKDVLISPVLKDGVLKVYSLNDDFEGYGAALKLRIQDFNGNVLWKDETMIYVSADSSELKYELDLSTITMDRNEAVLITEFKGDVRCFYFSKPKDLRLKNAEIQTKIEKTIEGFTIELKSTTLQKDVFLFTKNKGHFSNNYFDILPHETVEVHFKTTSEVLDDLQIKSFNNFIR